MKVKKTSDIRKFQKIVKKDMLGDASVPRKKVKKITKDFFESESKIS